MADLVPPVGPVDIAVLGFPTESPAPAVTTAIHDAVGSGAVRVLDALIVSKDEAGQVSVVDVDDPGDALELLGFAADLPGLLAEGDAVDVAAELPAGTSAVLIAWENVWAVRLRQAVSDAGGVIALHERIEATELTAAVETVVATTGER